MGTAQLNYLYSSYPICNPIIFELEYGEIIGEPKEPTFGLNV